MKNENHMKTEAQRIAIARAHLGYDDFDWLLWCDEEIVPVWEGRKLHGSKRAESKWHQVLDYTGDLNAMKDARKCLPVHLRAQYQNNLDKICASSRDPHCSCWDFIDAFPEQHAEAFLRTVGRWVEEEPEPCCQKCGEKLQTNRKHEGYLGYDILCGLCADDMRNRHE